MDPRDAALVAGIVLVPGLIYMAIEKQLAEPLAWLVLIGTGGGIMVVWAGAQLSEGGSRTVLAWIGGLLLLAGIVAGSFL